MADKLSSIIGLTNVIRDYYTRRYKESYKRHFGIRIRRRKKEVLEEDELERVYIDEIIPDIKDDEEKKEAWKIEIAI